MSIWFANFVTWRRSGSKEGDSFRKVNWKGGKVEFLIEGRDKSKWKENSLVKILCTKIFEFKFGKLIIAKFKIWLNFSENVEKELRKRLFNSNWINWSSRAKLTLLWTKWT